MATLSILFGNATNHDRDESLHMPDYFIDLNLDTIVDSITEGLDEYRLKHLFYTALKSIDEIEYRQEVFRDLESEKLFDQLKEFTETIRSIQKRLISLDTLYPCYQHGWFLESALKYCRALTSLLNSLTECRIKSRALSAVKEYVAGYIASEGFSRLSSEAAEIKSELNSIEYRITIKDLSVTVGKCTSNVDYAGEIEKSFDKFGPSAAKIYFDSGDQGSAMNQVQAKILECVARLFPGTFDRLSAFMKNNETFIDENILIFERELAFYLGYLSYIRPFQHMGLPFCIPEFSTTGEELGSRGMFDLALAEKTRFQNTPIVQNDWSLKTGERIIVVTGPNQGGKTTFARAIGQIHHLAGIGCPVPGSFARVLLFDKLYTHFEREEAMKSLHGKLQDEILRIHEILKKATPRSVIILNEMFTSTTLKDSRFLSKKILSSIEKIGSFCVCVTFLDELSRLSNTTASFVGGISPGDPSVKTFKIERKEADGLAYALAIAEKHGVTYRQLMERIKP
jgi:DNA mismatch repair ATPase MutS